MDKRKPVITFDTSCIYSEGRSPPEIAELEGLHKQGRLQIVKTDVVDTELLKSRKKGLKQKSAAYDEDLGVVVIGHSRVNHALIADNESEDILRELMNIVFPDFENYGEGAKDGAIRDAMHLMTHHRYKRDFFVTRDEHHIIKKATQLEGRYGIIVLTPIDCLKRLRAILT